MIKTNISVKFYSLNRFQRRHILNSKNFLGVYTIARCGMKLLPLFGVRMWGPTNFNPL